MRQLFNVNNRLVTFNCTCGVMVRLVASPFYIAERAVGLISTLENNFFDPQLIVLNPGVRGIDYRRPGRRSDSIYSVLDIIFS